MGRPKVDERLCDLDGQPWRQANEIQKVLCGWEVVVLVAAAHWDSCADGICPQSTLKYAGGGWVVLAGVSLKHDSDHRISIKLCMLYIS